MTILSGACVLFNVQQIDSTIDSLYISASVHDQYLHLFVDHFFLIISVVLMLHLALYLIKCFFHEMNDLIVPS